MEEIGVLDDIEMETNSMDIQCTKRWKIRRFLSLRDAFYCSSHFSFAGDSWQFIFCRGDGNIHGPTYTCLVMRKFSGPGRRISCSLSLETRDGRNVLVEHQESTADIRGCFVFHNFVSRSELTRNKSELMPSGRLSIVCCMKCLDSTEDAGTSSASSSKDIISGKSELSNNKEDKATEIPLSKYKGMEMLSENLKQVFQDGRMSDAVLKADGKDFNVHKVILVARSPVFASMFQHDMAEKMTNEVDIPDCTAESFEAFLHYLYTGSAETLSTSNVYNVYYAADKYQVNDLKEECVKFLMKNISVETFCDVIDLSLRHGESELQKTATDFFCQNFKGIIKTVQWLKYMETNVVQANELFIKLHTA